MTPRPRLVRPRGFTLIELLVVISIIGILVGLLLPAVNSAREAGRRTQCQSNMRNIVLAVLGYTNNQNVFPPAGEFGEDATTLTALTSGNTLPTGSVVPTWFPNQTSQRGVPMYSWVVPTLPYMDNQELYNQWTFFYSTGSNAGSPAPYFDTGAFNIAGQASNLKIADTAIGILRCPDDNTIQINQGNLSYVVNGGMALWQALPVGWIGGQLDGSPTTTPINSPLVLAPTAMGWAGSVGVMVKTGVMFTESTLPQGVPSSIRIPWNVRSTLNGIVDGPSSTFMMSENTLTGVSATPTPYSNGLTTNWATPLPTFTSFFMPSSVCGVPNSYNCTSGMLTPSAPGQGDIDGLGWAFANKVGTFTNINFGQNLTFEGSFPFSNSAHPGGCNMGFCDGAVRFIRNTIDGTVYSKIITPAGSKLPIYMKQLPVEQDAFVN